VRYRKLGDSDIEVSEISLGSWLTYSGGVEGDQLGGDPGVLTGKYKPGG
jgi:aryl-alcohol dehydrogenase-like predicted oxidoreductase